MKLPVSVLIMTQNEQANIKYAIESVIDAFEQVIIADSFSTDNTINICRQYPGVEVYQNKFEDWAEQRNWMLKNCNIRNDIIFFLDADEYVTEDFTEELKNIITDEKLNKFSAAGIKFMYVFLGRKMKYAGHPYHIRIFKKSQAGFRGEGAREYCFVEENIIVMKVKVFHHDRKPMSYWIEKHNRNSDLEVDLYFNRTSAPKKLRTPLKVRTWIRNNIWDKLPLLIRPLFYFIYKYIFRLGFLDGKEGLIYCYLHAFWYRSLIDIKIIERIKNEKRC